MLGIGKEVLLAMPMCSFIVKATATEYTISV